MAPPDNYSLDDIEEILRSTDSQLESSIDLNRFAPHNVRGFEMPFEVDLNTSSLENKHSKDELQRISDKLISRTTNERKRTFSVSSMDDDSFNPDDFINSLHSDDVKLEYGNGDELRQRNTPSPTGSCSSSGGSSTSGVQSDISSVASRSQTQMELYSNTELENSARFKHPVEIFPSPIFHIKKENSLSPKNLIPSMNEQTLVLPAADTNSSGVSMPVILPLISMNAPTSSTASGESPVQALSATQQVQSIHVLHNTLIPVKSVMPIQPTTQLNSNIKCPTQVKVESKLAPKTMISNKTNTNKAAVAHTQQNTTKIVPPTNSKPKTVFLTMSDYKALTQINNKIGKGLNANTPRIVLKTASGKVITANKIVSSGNSALDVNHNFIPKIIKTSNGTMVPKQLASRSFHGSNSAVGSSKNTICGATPGVYKCLIDEKIWKKQQRMIKNRESASLSRKKKKEYVFSLETRINALEKENCLLKGENSSIRSQLVAFAKSCQCQNSNISEFVLNALDVNTQLSGGDQHTNMGPKPLGKSIKQRMSASNVKKNIAILFAMAFMVSMNIGNFQNYMNRNTIQNSIESTTATADEPIATGRRLLWAETENEFKQKLNKTKHAAEMDVPPLHFLHSVNRSRAAQNEQRTNRTGKEQLTIRESKCDNGSTYTENHRLHRNLRKWIDVNDYWNLSLYKKHGNVLDNTIRFGKFVSDYYDRKPLQLPLQESVPAIKVKRKIVLPPATVSNKQPKLDMEQQNKTNNMNEYGNKKNSLDIFKHKIGDEYLRLFKGIKRQDDTFYVLSFNMDHILLPASAYNKSARPKMSLMLPSGDPSLNGDVTLMQIDCEVLNTAELQLKSSMIPQKLRPQKFANGNGHAMPNSSDMVNNETLTRDEQHKKKVSIPEMPKQKSPPETYYMVGPRSAAAAATMKRGPVLIRLDSNESIENITSNVEENVKQFSNVYKNQ